jgi:hypothetical protein
MTTNEQRLQQQFDRAIQEYVAASQASAMAAMERAFCAMGPHPRTKSGAAGVRGPRKASKRRTASELTALSEQLFNVIAAQPGEPIGTLSAQLNTSAKTLERAVARLRQDGRIRTVGERQRMRYFPKP